MTERDEAFEELKSGHGLLRELPGLRVWGVDDGALVLGEDATQFVFCSQGALVVRQTGAWPHVLTAGMYGAVPGKCEVRPVGQDLSQGLVISRHGWLGMVDDGVPAREIQKRLGMEREEVVRLVNRAGMPAQVTKGKAGALNRAWVPGKG
jgi:hypothetical protein